MISNPKMNGVLRKTKDKLNINLYWSRTND